MRSLNPANHAPRSAKTHLSKQQLQPNQNGPLRPKQKRQSSSKQNKPSKQSNQLEYGMTQ